MPSVMAAAVDLYDLASTRTRRRRLLAALTLRRGLKCESGPSTVSHRVAGERSQQAAINRSTRRITRID